MTVKIYIPRDAAAVALGAEKVAKAIAREIEARGLDAKVVRNGSRGMFWLEPLVEVETDKGRVAYGPVKAGDVAGLFDAGLIEGKSHDLCFGLTEEIDFLRQQTRLTFARCGIVDPRSLDDDKAHDGYKGLARTLAMAPLAAVEEVTQSGLRGRGGAGFPTGIKWKTVAVMPAEQKYIICNADEGDSGTFADRMIMEGDPFVLIEGMTIAGIAVGATKGYIYVRSEYPHAIAVLNDAIQAARSDCTGIIINPAAYSHTSVAIRDALSAAELPVVEVHLSNIHTREAFRHHSYVSAVAQVVIAGAGPAGYEYAVRYLAERQS